MTQNSIDITARQHLLKIKRFVNASEVKAVEKIRNPLMQAMLGNL